MTVLFPATHYYPVIGGIENWTQNIAEKLSLVAEIFVVTGKVKYQSQKQELNGVRIWRTSLFNLSNLSASPLIYTLSLLPFVFFKSLFLIKKEKVDIIHCQGFLSSFLGFFLSKFTGIPYITTVQRLEGNKNPLKNFIYRNASLCIGASRAIKDYFEEIGCKRVELIPNGIDLKRFEGLERKPHQGFVVMTVARLEKVKGIEYLIKAVKNFQFPISNFQLLVIGDGSERKNLEKLIGERNLANKVKLLGFKENAASYLDLFDIFTLTSVKEGLPYTILEAGLAGLPVIASDVGGVGEIIENNESGILVGPKNVEQIVEALNLLVENKELRKKFGENLKKTVERKFSLKQMFAMTVGVYKNDQL